MSRTRSYIACGFGHSLFINEDKDVYGIGSNRSGEIGWENIVESLIPIKIRNINNVISVSCGSLHSMILTEDNLVYSFGNNCYGQLGRKSKSSQPTLINLEIPITEIYCSRFSSFVIDINGRVKGFGNNDKNLMGMGKEYLDINIFEPLTIEGLENIIDISSQYQATIFLNNKGNIFVAGDNSRNLLGLGDNKEKIINKPIKNRYMENIFIRKISSGINHTLLLTEEGYIYGFGSNEYDQIFPNDKRKIIKTPVKIDELENIKDISCFSMSTLILNDKDELYGYGDNTLGELCINYLDDSIYPILIAENIKYLTKRHEGFHNLIVDKDRNIYSFGWNEDGQLGIGNKIRSNHLNYLQYKIPFENSHRYSKNPYKI